MNSEQVWKVLALQLASDVQSLLANEPKILYGACCVKLSLKAIKLQKKADPKRVDEDARDARRYEITQDLLSRIQNYLGNGGLFNPEMMEHDKVRDLIVDCRNYLDNSVLKNP